MNDDFMPPESLDGTMEMLQERADMAPWSTGSLGSLGSLVWAMREMFGGDSYDRGTC